MKYIVGFLGVLSALAVGPLLFSAEHTFEYIPQDVAGDVYIEEDLLPDLVPLPAEDLAVAFDEEEEVRLHFSTTYFNQGKGPLELVADPATKGLTEDVDRDVSQLIHTQDGGVHERRAGTFSWHEEHFHFHFTDFVLYELTPLTVDAPNISQDLHRKATFCVRDVSRVFLDLANASEDAEFKFCSRERQGVSVGWGDSYLAGYPDQDLIVTGLPTGEYELSFFVNPKRRFLESDYSNNRSSVRLFIDMELKTVEVFARTPENSPEVEHVYIEQPFGEGENKKSI